MDELIKIDYTNEIRPTVLGRDLHRMLGVETPYRLWFPRMCEYGFSDGVDYTPYNFVHPQNHQEITDHQLTIPMAKELCMLQRTDRGKECRQYFIQIEEAWNSPEAVMARALQMANHTVERLKENNAALAAKVDEQQAQLEEQKPQVDFAKHVSDASDLLTIAEFAKIVQDEDIKIGRNKLFDWLRENEYIRPGSREPYQRYVDQGLFRVKETVKHHAYGYNVFPQTFITGKGQIYFVEKLRSQFKANQDQHIQ